jgi:hypothetical protein
MDTQQQIQWRPILDEAGIAYDVGLIDLTMPHSENASILVLFIDFENGKRQMLTVDATTGWKAKDHCLRVGDRLLRCHESQ